MRLHSNTPPEPGNDPAANYADLIDQDVLERVIRRYSALAGSPHVPRDQVDQVAADLLPPAVWAGEVGHGQ